MFAKGVTVFYGAAVAACAFAVVKVAPPTYDAIRDLTAAMRESAEVMHHVTRETAEARAAAGRVEQAQVRVEERLGKIEADVGALARDIRVACPRR